MPLPALSPSRPVDLGRLDVTVLAERDGVLYAHSPFPLENPAARVTDWLDHWASRAPARIFLAERRREAWEHVTYAEARAKVRALAQGLLNRGLGPERPLVILSGNSIAHALLGLAALYVGIPYAPVSPAYSRASPDFGRLKCALQLLTPGLVFADDGRLFAEAIAAAVPQAVPVLVCDAHPQDRRAQVLMDLPAPVDPALDAAHQAVAPHTIAKFMLTSGSTGDAPKAVITTNRMLCANQAMIAHALRFLRAEPPTLVDWLPWSHSFGGNQNFNLALCHGGSLYIDGGRPTPDGMATTLASLRAIAPTLYFSVPKGFEALHPHLARDRALAGTFFRSLKLSFFAGAPLGRHHRDALDTIAQATCGERIAMLSGFGATETAPASLFGTVHADDDSLGVPLPGCELKLVSHGEKREALVRGPHVTPGYWRQPDRTQRAFDAEGYFRLGDALDLADASQPRRGFRFEGRVTEDFKLSTGAWVSVGPLRDRFIAAFAPFVTDVVIAGHGEASLTALVYPDIDTCRNAIPAPTAATGVAGILAHPAVQNKFRARLADFTRAATGSSLRVARLALLAEPPSAAAGEVTDKGTLNQGAVLARKAGLLRDIYAGRSTGFVIEAAPAPQACDTGLSGSVLA